MRVRLKHLGLIDLFGLIISGCLIFVTDTFVGDPGVGWHLRNGELIATNGAVPREDPFLLTTRGNPWVSDQWLSDLLFWKVFTLGGYPLIHLLVVIVVTSIFVLILPRLLRQIGGRPMEMLAVLALTAFVCAAQWIFRPVIFSFFFLALVVSLVYGWYDSLHQRVSLSPRKLFIPPLLFLVWVNLHPAFPLGLVFILLCTIALFFDGYMKNDVTLRQGTWRVAICLLISVGATFLNPYGPEMYRNISTLFGNEYFMNLNSEWLAIDFQLIIFFPMLVTLLLLLVVLARKKQCNLRTLDLLLLASFLFMVFQQRRYVPFFAIVAAPILVRLFGKFVREDGESDEVGVLAGAAARIAARDRNASRGGYTVFLVLSVLVATLMSGHIPFRKDRPPEPGKIYPERAVDAIAALEGTERIFHTPDWGGYLTWRLWPTHFPYIDDRNGLVSRELYEEFFTLDRLKPGWQAVLSKYHFDTLLLRTNSPLGFALEAKANWELVYEDESARVLRRH